MLLLLLLLIIYKAFDEVVVNGRLDMQELANDAAQKEKKIIEERNKATEDAEKQKALVLQYVEFMKLRNAEVMNGYENLYEKEKKNMKQVFEKCSKKYYLLLISYFVRKRFYYQP
jgi:hypothetical protein